MLGGAAEGGMLTSGGRDYGDAFTLRCARTHTSYMHTLGLSNRVKSIAPIVARHGSESPLTKINV